MPKSSNQKLKLIYLMKILLERTDETHSITMSEIIDALGLGYPVYKSAARVHAPLRGNPCP